MPTPAKSNISMSFRVEYQSPEFDNRLASTKIASWLLFPAAPYSLNPESKTLVAGLLLTCGITNTGSLLLMDCKAVPLQGAAVQATDPAFPPEAPMPIIFRPFRSVI